MNELIWIGNTLLPRWLVFGAAFVLVVVLVAIFVIATDDGP